MDPMNFIVAKNIRRLREERRLSIEELARLSGVSKSMLAQVERGDGNPTISTLWKISNGMKVPFDALTVRAKEEYELVKTDEIQPVLEDGGRVRNYPLFPDDENRRFAVYYLELDPGSFWESEPHLKGTAELITVFGGRIEINAGIRQFWVGERESVRFRADTVHSYRNVGEKTAILHMILFYP